jgi:hypothetical protein
MNIELIFYNYDYLINLQLIIQLTLKIGMYSYNTSKKS